MGSNLKKNLLPEGSFVHRLQEINSYTYTHLNMTFSPFDPQLPIPVVALYLSVVSSVLILCLLSFVAIFRTKKTPYATKLLSMGLLSYDSLFLFLSCISRLFAYRDVYIVSHITRGLQLASQILVGCMALERLFVLNWPYIYLRVVTERRTRVVCLGVYMFSFLQYVAFRGTICYAMNRPINCGLGVPIYFMVVSVVVPAVAFLSFVKVFKIIRKCGGKLSSTRHAARQYKGTVASFWMLINTTFTQLVWLGLAVLYFARTDDGKKETGEIAVLADCSNIVNCIVDPLIYVVWFKETRMELLNLVIGICPCVKPRIKKLRFESYHVNLPSHINASTDCSDTRQK